MESSYASSLFNWKRNQKLAPRGPCGGVRTANNFQTRWYFFIIAAVIKLVIFGVETTNILAKAHTPVRIVVHVLRLVLQVAVMALVFSEKRIEIKDVHTVFSKRRIFLMSAIIGLTTYIHYDALAQSMTNTPWQWTVLVCMLMVETVGSMDADVVRYIQVNLTHVNLENACRDIVTSVKHTHNS